MTPHVDPTLPRCTEQARQLGEDPVGSAPPWKRCLVFELPAPWEARVEFSRAFPDEPRQVLGQLEARGERVRLQCVLPDPEYSIPGTTRLILFSRPADVLASCGRAEYLVPSESAAEVACALLEDGSIPERFDQWREHASPAREILICTHGNRDACCGSYGVPIYESLRKMADEDPLIDGTKTRVWRTSHTGGHRFAPTLIDLPEGRYWAFVDSDLAADVLRRRGDLGSMVDRYRGWAALASPAEQNAERAAFARVGWNWVTAQKRIETFGAVSGIDRHRIRFTYTESPAHPPGCLDVSVEYAGSVPTMNCMKRGSKGDNPQYRIVE
ncbi:MAG: hypothetical protein OXS35_02775 [Dehalococcoidia bacterium]|nr:hypothetical protein [Dehalococcoidia bacterium]